MTPVDQLAFFSDSIIYLSVLLIPFYLWGNDRKKLFLYSLSFVAVLVSVYLIKITLAVPRPALGLIPMPATPSFPSMHASLGLLPAGFFFHVKKYKVPLIAYGSLIAYSRVLLGVHYWMDIFTGAVIGFLIPLTIFYKKKKVLKFFRLDKK